MKPQFVLVFSLFGASTEAQQFGAQQVVTHQAAGVSDVEAADFNNDGTPDIVAAVTDLNAVVWFENYGTGSFSAGVVVSSGLYRCTHVSAGDLDGDGDVDVVSLSEGADSLWWHENLGAGAFSSASVISQQVDGGKDLAVGDLDGDGDIDILTASAMDTTFGWFENLGGGVFAPRVKIMHGYRPIQVALADLDGDGDMDVIGSESGRGSGNSPTIQWVENLGGGQFSTTRSISEGLRGDELIPADLDSDGDVDIVVSAFGGVSWLENLGSGQFARELLLGQLGSRVDICVEDWDDNGSLDLGFDESSSISVAFGQGNAGFASPTHVTSDVIEVTSLASADLDQDGHCDLISASSGDGKVAWYRFIGGGDLDQDDDGLLDAEELASFGTNPTVFDTDGDGLGDGLEVGIAVGTPDTDPSVFVPDEDPSTTTDPLSVDTDSGGVEDGIEDQNQDGRVDTWETDPNVGADESLAFYVSNLSPGANAHFEVYNATPLQGLFPAYSVAGPGPTALGIGVTVDLSQPINTVTPVLADIDGRASWDGPRVPGGISLGVPVWLQLVEVSFTGSAPRVSNPLLLPVGSN